MKKAKKNVRKHKEVTIFQITHMIVLGMTSYTCPGYDVKLHPVVLHLLSSLCRSLWRSLAPLRYW